MSGATKEPVQKGLTREQIARRAAQELREIDGRTYVLEPAITGDFAIVKAWKGDRYGNLVYRHTAMNFNPMMATAAKVTIAEVEELVDVGELDPDHIHTPGIFVHRIVKGTGYEKRIERRTLRSSVSPTQAKKVS